MEQKQKPERYRMPAAHSLAPGKVLNYEYLSNRALETISAQLDYGLDRLDYLIGLEQERSQINSDMFRLKKEQEARQDEE